MKVSELGEFGLIDLLAEKIEGGRGKQGEGRLIIGIGDDAAAWRKDAGVELAAIDSMVEGSHFTLDKTSWREVGWKSLAINLSDIAAMGGVPEYALVSLALPGDTDVEEVVALYEGMIELARQFGVALIGGDTVGAPQLAVTVAVVGRAKGQVLTRSAARPGEVVAVTGWLGAAAAGVRALREDMPLGEEAMAQLKRALLRPHPRVAEGLVLVEQGVAAAIDISDGLVADLNHICRSSGVTARIRADRVPIAPAVAEGFGERALELALAGGEDYELLFTATASRVDRVKSALSCPVTVIGEVRAGGTGAVELVDSRGQPVGLPGTGWDHFAAKRSQR